MIRILLTIVFLGLLSGCGGGGGRPLPVINKSDPTYTLVPDRLEMGSLPQ